MHPTQFATSIAGETFQLVEVSKIPKADLDSLASELTFVTWFYDQCNERSK